MPQQTIAQDVASIIAKQVTEQIEEVRGTGIMTASDRKAVDDYLYSKFVPEESSPDYYRSERVHYSLNGDQIDFERDYTTSAYNTTDADFFLIVFTTDKTTRRGKRQTVTYLSVISLYVIPKEGQMQDPLFTTRYMGNESISRESAIGMFEKVLGVIRKTKKCSVCEAYKHDIVCRKVGICPECHMHDRVKRARTAELPN